MKTVLLLVRSRLARRLTALFLLASMLPLAGAGSLVLRGIEETTREDAQRRQAALGEAAAGLVRQWIARSTDKLATMGRLRTAKSAQRRNARQILAELTHLVEPSNLFLEVQQIGGSTQKPQLLGQTTQKEYELAQQSAGNLDEELELQFLANVNSPIVQDVYRGKAQAQSPQPTTNFGFRTLQISAPFEADAGKRERGVLIGYLDLRRLDELLAPVVSAGMQLIVESPAAKVISSAGPPVEDAIESRVPVRYSDWEIRVREPRALVEASTSAARRRVWIGLGLAALLACVSSLFFASRILRPLRTLTSTAERLERGDLTARTGIDRQDEIGRLGRSFDAMAAALEKLDDAKSTFVGTVSHELRTPLTSLRLSVANLAEGVVGPLDSKQQKSVERIARDVDRLIARVSDLLALAKLEAGVETPALETLDLRGVATTCAETLRPLADARDIRVEIDGCGEGTADRSMLERIVVNLLDNAIKFAPAASTITILVSDHSIRVCDQGAGIAEPALFSAFAQGKASGVKSPGVGLGLAIVKKLADLLGAKIEAVQGEPSYVELRLVAASE